MLIKLLQWNVSYQEKPENLARFLRGTGADIICAQEIIKDSRMGLDVAQHIAKTLDFAYYFHAGDTWDCRPDKEVQGNAIFSRFPIESCDYTYVQDPKHNPPDSAHEGRVYIEAVIEAGAKQLTISTTHLSHSDGYIITPERKDEIDRLLEILRTRKSNYVFTADRNSLPDSYAITQIENILRPSGPDYGCLTKRASTESSQLSKPAYRLDYVFNSPDMSPIAAEMLDSPYSDHLPLQVGFEI